MELPVYMSTTGYIRLVTTWSWPASRYQQISPLGKSRTKNRRIHYSRLRSWNELSVDSYHKCVFTASKLSWYRREVQGRQRDSQ